MVIRLVLLAVLVHDVHAACTVTTTMCYDGTFRRVPAIFGVKPGCSTSAPCADHARVLGSNNFNDYDELSLEYCAQLCYNNNYTLAGAEDGSQCYCGNSVSPDAPKRDPSECNTPCTQKGFPNNNKCGGDWRISIYPVNCSGDPVPSPSSDVPAGFDCKTRALAMEFAVALQPWRSSSSFELIADMLNTPGGAPGGLTQCFNTTYTGPTQTFSPTFPNPAADTLTFYVSPLGSDGVNSGALGSPFFTVARALAQIRAKRVPGASDRGTIVLLAGTTYVAETIELTAEDSGLTVQNYEGQVLPSMFRIPLSSSDT
jgi:hypothetical protein